MDQLSTMVASMVTLSIAVERIIEILKGLVPWLRDSAPAVVIHVLAALAGWVIAWIVDPHTLLAAIPMGSNKLMFSTLLGLMASGGSAFWNHALDIMGAVKAVREASASQVTRSTQAAPQTGQG
jgi:hypothetical protein